MDLQVLAKIITILVFVGPLILYFVFNIKPKKQYISVIKEETNELPEDEIDYFLVDIDPYKK